MNLKIKILTAILLFLSLTAWSRAQVVVEPPKIVPVPQSMDQKIKAQGEVVGNTEKIVKSAPFSAEAITESVQTLGDGNKITRRTKTKMYRDKEGCFRREEFAQPNGNIGSIVAERAIGLKMRVIAYDPFLSDQRAQELGVEKATLDQVLARALVRPLTPVQWSESDEAAYRAEIMRGGKPGPEVQLPH